MRDPNWFWWAQQQAPLNQMQDVVIIFADARVASYVFEGGEVEVESWPGQHWKPIMKAILSKVRLRSLAVISLSLGIFRDIMLYFCLLSSIKAWIFLVVTMSTWVVGKNQCADGYCIHNVYTVFGNFPSIVLPCQSCAHYPSRREGLG